MDPYSGGERSDKHAKPDALSAPALPLMGIPSPPGTFLCPFLPTPHAFTPQMVLPSPPMPLFTPLENAPSGPVHML